MERKRILLIDDEKEFCQLVRTHLELDGSLEVFTATSGSEGLDAARQVKPDMVLLDIMMPGGMDGFEVLKALKKDPRTVPIPVVMLTAMQDDASKIEATRLYDEDYITKPVKLKELKIKVEKILHRCSR
jgi:DNA-binding response OmpR family regulator